MSKYSNSKNKVSDQTKDDAMKVARASQKSGQTKEQTKLIAQGIEHGIAQYKKQQKEKSRELNRRLKKVSNVSPSQADSGQDTESGTKPKSGIAWLPWLLLIITWSGFGLYLTMV